MWRMKNILKRQINEVYFQFEKNKKEPLKQEDHFFLKKKREKTEK